MTTRAPAALPQHRRPNLGREISRLVRRDVTWAVIIAVAVALAVVIPTVAGDTALTILTGPLVIIRPTAPHDLRIGDVITRLFTTRGDANGSDDPRPVWTVQITGKKWHFVPHLGSVNSLLSPEERGIGQLAIAAALFTYALWMLLSNPQGRRTGTTPHHEREGAPGTALVGFTSSSRCSPAPQNGGIDPLEASGTVGVHNLRHFHFHDTALLIGGVHSRLRGPRNPNAPGKRGSSRIGPTASRPTFTQRP